MRSPLSTDAPNVLPFTTTDADILRSAYLMLKEHGDEAALVAADRVAELVDKGDTRGAAVSLAIAAAVLELQEARRGEAAN